MRAAADLRLRQRGYWDRQKKKYIYITYEKTSSETWFASDVLVKFKKLPKVSNLIFKAGRCTFEERLPDLLENSRFGTNHLKSTSCAFLANPVRQWLLWHTQ